MLFLLVVEAVEAVGLLARTGGREVGRAKSAGHAFDRPIDTALRRA